MSAVMPVGWPVTLVNLTFPRGASDTVRHALQILQPNLQPLPDYTGYVFDVIWRDALSNETGMTKSGVAATPDATANRIICDLQITSADTEALKVGKYIGTMTVRKGDEKQVPFLYAIEVTRGVGATSK